MQTLRARRLVLASVLSLCAATAFGQATATKQEKSFKPTVGQEGKDVVWVPTSQALVNRMLDMAKVTANDILYDLGSGDGRTVITAAKRGAQALRRRIQPEHGCALASAMRRRKASRDKAQFIHGDIFQTDFSKATVITLFLLPELNVKLRPKILDMKPGTRVVSNSFTMGDWQADRDSERERKRRLHGVLHRVSLDRAGQGRRHAGSCPTGSSRSSRPIQQGDGLARCGGRASVKGRCDGDQMTLDGRRYPLQPQR